jgi:hypothetical protein
MVAKRPPPGSVGLRAAPRRPASAGDKADDKVESARSQVRERVEGTKEEHRKKVWEKLDSAKRLATDKLSRLRSFQTIGRDRGR